MSHPPASKQITETNGASPDALLDVHNLRVEFHLKGQRRGKILTAVNGISFVIQQGETLGLVGESGSGKSTTGRALIRLVRPTEGRLLWRSRDLATLSNRQFKSVRQEIQMVFQDPYSSLNPSMPISQIVGEPIEIHFGLKGKERDQVAGDYLEQVQLPRQLLSRYPYEFSGGQRQRIAIARALAVDPQLIICDEPVSALDVSTQNQVLNLLERLRDEHNLSYLFIAHDLAVVRHISHRIAVMYLGDIVESGPTERIMDSPAHPYTEALLAAVPSPKPSDRNREVLRLTGELPDPTERPSGCSFRTRCPYAMAICEEEVPHETEVDDGGSVACHLQSTGPELAGKSLNSLTMKEKVSLMSNRMGSHTTSSL